MASILMHYPFKGLVGLIIIKHGDLTTYCYNNRTQLPYAYSNVYIPLMIHNEILSSIGDQWYHEDIGSISQKKKSYH